MTANISSYNDFQGLARLRSEAAARAPEATREAARQFEALFVEMMLKSMREANAVLGEQRDTTYEEMFDKQIALEMTKGKGLGMADLMARQLGGEPEGKDGTSNAALPLKELLTRIPALRKAITPDTAGLLPPGFVSPATPDVDAPTLGAAGSRTDFRPASRTEFVREIWPMAVQAGRQLGVDPRAIVAQAALETGWGSRQVRDDAGVSGNNLFNIKADRSWSGERVTVTTLEYEGGLPKPERAQFRAYCSLAEGFQDYVRFLKDNPRYGEALRAGHSPHVFADRLQSAGYATDPRYAQKIRDIIDGPILGQFGDALKLAGELPNYL